MRCIEAQEQLVAAHDGELGPSALEVLREHLEGCVHCREWDARLRALDLDQRLIIPPEVQEALEAATDPQQVLRAPSRGWAPPRWPLAAAAAAMLLAAVGLSRSLPGPARQAPTVIAGRPIAADQWQPASMQQAEPGDVPTYDTNLLHLPAPPADGKPR